MDEQYLVAPAHLETNDGDSKNKIAKKKPVLIERIHTDAAFTFDLLYVIGLFALLLFVVLSAATFCLFSLTAYQSILYSIVSTFFHGVVASIIVFLVLAKLYDISFKGNLDHHRWKCATMIPEAKFLIMEPVKKNYWGIFSQRDALTMQELTDIFLDLGYSAVSFRHHVGYFSVHVGNIYDAKRLYTHVKKGIAVVHTERAELTIRFLSYPEYDVDTPLLYWLKARNSQYVLHEESGKGNKYEAMMLDMLPGCLLRSMAPLWEWDPLFLGTQWQYFSNIEQFSVCNLRRAVARVNKDMSFFNYYVTKRWLIVLMVVTCCLHGLLFPYYALLDYAMQK